MSSHLTYTVLRSLRREMEKRCVECGAPATYQRRVNLIDPKTDHDRWIYACEEHLYTEAFLVPVKSR